jgi:hypothetical protein
VRVADLEGVAGVGRQREVPPVTAVGHGQLHGHIAVAQVDEGVRRHGAAALVADHRADREVRGHMLCGVGADPGAEGELDQVERLGLGCHGQQGQERRRAGARELEVHEESSASQGAEPAVLRRTAGVAMVRPL